VEKGKVVAKGTTAAAGTDGRSLITFQEVDGGLTYNQNDLGTHTLTIYEVAGDDDSITYATTRFYADITISPAGGGKLKYEVVYDAQKAELLDKTTGYPIFVNEYNAEGDLELTGTKKLVYKDSTEEASVSEGQFTFTVKEGDKIVATGKTKQGGEIAFDKISYTTEDIGTTHTYTITEDKGKELFVEYTKDKFDVVVEVTDAGKGILDAKVTKVKKNGKDVSLDENYPLTFTNIYTFKVPTGIRLDVLPYAIAVVLAVCLGMLMFMRRRKRR
jgi:pilin isopeptide linkage protein